MWMLLTICRCASSAPAATTSALAGAPTTSPAPHRGKQFRHPVVGELDLDFEAMSLTADAGLTLTAYTAEPGSPAAERLQLLANWAASEQIRLDQTSAT